MRIFNCRKRSKAAYRYHTGKANCFADPWDLWNRLFHADVDLFDLCQTIHDDTGSFDDQQKNDALNTAVEHVATVMNLHRLDTSTGKGLTRKAILSELDRFYEFVERQMKVEA